MIGIQCIQPFMYIHDITIPFSQNEFGKRYFYNYYLYICVTFSVSLFFYFLYRAILYNKNNLNVQYQVMLMQNNSARTYNDLHKIKHTHGIYEYT